MADETTTTGGQDESAGSSDSAALTPEQRDEETIARLLGGGTTEDTSSDEGEESEDETDATATGEEDESDSDAGETASEEGETGADDELPEVTDEELETVLDALEDRIIANPRIQKAIEDKARADADRRYEERTKSETVSQESERLIRQGRTAVETVYGLFDKLTGNLDKAVKGDELTDADKKVPTREELMQNLGLFGAAAVAETRRNFDNAFADAFREGALVAGDMTDDEKAKVIGIVQTAQRIAGDPKQGQAQSIAYLFKENVKLLVERARTAGKAEAEAAFAKKRSALVKVTGENSTRAAVAKIATARKNLPTKPTSTPAEQSQPSANMDAYKAAKAAGDYDRADAIAAAMSGR